MFDEFSFDDLMEKVNGEPDGDAPDEEKKANVSSDLSDTIEKLKAEMSWDKNLRILCPTFCFY